MNKTYRLKIISMYCLVVAMLPAEVLYEDNFDGDTLAVNTSGIGGGAVSNTILDHSWTDDGNATFETSGTNDTSRALLYSANTFQSDSGFKLTVSYITGSIGDSGAHNLSFGLMDADVDLSTYAGFNPFKDETGVYSLGVNLTADGGASAQGLNFADGTIATTLDQSGTNAQFKTGEVSEVTFEFGLGGYWCYRIDGVYEASGVLLEGFDLSKNYQVVVYGQDDDGGGKSIQSLKLETAYVPGERAKDVRGTWSGGEIIWQVKDFKTLDTVGVGFNSGASQSAKHYVAHKLLESLSQGDVDENGNRINLLVPLWGDLNLDEPENDAVLERILEIRAAGFKVKAYSNAENFVGNNASEYAIAVQRWKDYCDTDPEVQAFINSQPFHTGVWNSSTEQYEIALNEDGSETYPNRKYMFCYTEYVLKDFAMRYGPLIGGWIFDSAGDIASNGDSATNGVIEDQRIFQAFANAIHAGNPEIPLAFNNGRSNLNYASYPFAHATRYDDFTFGHAFGGNNNHAEKVNGNQFNLNYRHVTRMVDTNGYVHDGGNRDWDDRVVGNFHSKLSTTSWTSGPNQAWEEVDFLQWTREAVKAGGSMTWGASTYTSAGVEQLRPWAYDLLKALDDHLAITQNPGAPNWARYATVLPDAVIGQAYYHVLFEDTDLWDPEGDEITSVSPVAGAPVWLNISEDPLNPGHWILSGIPTENGATKLEFSLQATDANSLSGEREVELQVVESAVTIIDPSDGSPAWVSDPLPLPEAYRYKDYSHLLRRGNEFQDFEGDALTMTLSGGPAWLSLEAVAPDVWQLSGSPEGTDFGLNSVLLTLSDGIQSSSAIVQIDVTDDQYLDLAVNSINGGAYWTNVGPTAEPGDLVYKNRKQNFDYRALMYSTQAFQSDGGFRLKVHYTTGNIGSSLAHNFSFGLISTDTDMATYSGLNPFRADETVYSLGVNLTTAGDASARGLNFTDGAVRTTLDESGTNAQFEVDASTEVIIEVTPNGAWSYSINGVEEATGVIAGGFDLSKHYRVAFYGQDDNGVVKSIQSMALDLLEVPFYGLLAEWNFDVGSSSDVVDSSMNSFDATAYNATLVSGLEGQAMSFDGSSSYVDLPSEVASLISSEVTVSMWVNGDVTQPSADTIFNAVDSNGRRVLNIHLPWSNSKVIWDAGNSGGNNYDRISKDAVPAEFKGRWNHWVFTKSAVSEEMKIYLNGTLWQSAIGMTRSMDGITALFLGSNDGESHYSGIIDEVKLYNVVLSDAEVAELYDDYEGYEAWTSRHPSLEALEPDADGDSDGVGALLEYILNGDPLEPDQLILPTLDADGEDFVFTFKRNAESAGDTIQVFQYSSDLANWYDLNITGTAATEVSVGDEIEGAEEVTVTVSKGLAEDGQLFGRLKVDR
ncbi:MAG: LamG domain-containing protein [Opitutaceae bacterium]